MFLLSKSWLEKGNITCIIKTVNRRLKLIAKFEMLKQRAYNHIKYKLPQIRLHPYNKIKNIAFEKV